MMKKKLMKFREISKIEKIEKNEYLGINYFTIFFKNFNEWKIF